MKKNILKMISLLLAAGCSTAYDEYGRPQQSVDPALATAGVAAAGLIGYSLAKNRHKDNDHRYRRGNHRNYRGRGSHRSHRSRRYNHH